MSKFRRNWRWNKSRAWICLLALILCGCAEMPEFCGDKRFDPAKQFCFGGEAFNKCGNWEFNPNTHGCNGNSAVWEKCEGGRLVPPGTPCATTHYTLETASNPATGGNVSRVPNSASYIAGTQVTVTATAAEGYTFTNWSGTSSSTNREVTVTMNANMTLTAHFQQQASYTLTVNRDPTAGGSVTGGGTFTSGTNASISAAPNYGYTFTGWTGDGVASPSSHSTTVLMTANRTVTANFHSQQTNYTLTVNRSPTAGGNVTGGGTFTSGTNAPISATVNSGYTFAGWTGDGVASPSSQNTTVLMTTNRTVTANYFQQQVNYTLTVNRTPTAGGSVTGGGTFTSGTNATISATPNSGYTFTGWTGDGVTSPSSQNTTVLMTSNRTVIANFQQQQINYTLTLNRVPTAGGSVIGGGTFTSGTNATISAAPNSGYTFTGWTGDGVANPSSQSTSVLMNANKTVTANFQQQQVSYTLTVNPDPTVGGSVTGGGTFTSGTNASISATPNSGYTFIGWTGDGVTSPSSQTTTVSMTTNRTVIANFRVNCTYTGRIVTIGGRTWMAENLNCETTDSWCYRNSPDNCAKYGRLYTWDAARTVCPVGWRLSTDSDWSDLVRAAGGSDVAGRKLKSTSGWGWDGGTGGTDELGFSALPGGLRHTDGNFYNADNGTSGNWWSATENSSGSASFWDMLVDRDNVDRWSTANKGRGCSVRCVRD